MRMKQKLILKDGIGSLLMGTLAGWLLPSWLAILLIFALLLSYASRQRTGCEG